MKILARVQTTAATRVEAVRQPLHRGQRRAHAAAPTHMRRLLHVVVVLVRLVVRVGTRLAPRVPLLRVLLFLHLVVVRARRAGVRMSRVEVVLVVLVVVHQVLLSRQPQRVKVVRWCFASGCIGQAPDLGLRRWKGHPTVAACLVF